MPRETSDRMPHSRGSSKNSRDFWCDTKDYGCEGRSAHGIYDKRSRSRHRPTKISDCSRSRSPSISRLRRHWRSRSKSRSSSGNRGYSPYRSRSRSLSRQRRYNKSRQEKSPKAIRRSRSKSIGVKDRGNMNLPLNKNIIDDRNTSQVPNNVNGEVKDNVENEKMTDCNINTQITAKYNMEDDLEEPIDKEKIHKQIEEKLRLALAKEGKIYPPPKNEASHPVFANDGSFLEVFKKMQEQTKQNQQQDNANKILKPLCKRRGGKILKTGIVSKPKADNSNAETDPKDFWSIYLQEVKKYKNASCDIESKTRPLVK